ncbi:MAG: hypothetical protein IPO40_18410 [Fibrobacteres bacterium]|nr:hypothetical protein [Fibrobacterota bacterium]
MEPDVQPSELKIAWSAYQSNRWGLKEVAFPFLVFLAPLAIGLGPITCIGFAIAVAMLFRKHLHHRKRIRTEFDALSWKINDGNARFHWRFCERFGNRALFLHLNDCPCVYPETWKGRFAQMGGNGHFKWLESTGEEGPFGVILDSDQKKSSRSPIQSFWSPGYSIIIPALFSIMTLILFQMTHLIFFRSSGYLWEAVLRDGISVTDVLEVPNIRSIQPENQIGRTISITGPAIQWEPTENLVIVQGGGRRSRGRGRSSGVSIPVRIFHDIPDSAAHTNAFPILDVLRPQKKYSREWLIEELTTSARDKSRKQGLVFNAWVAALRQHTPAGLAVTRFESPEVIAGKHPSTYDSLLGEQYPNWWQNRMKIGFHGILKRSNYGAYYLDHGKRIDGYWMAALVYINLVSLWLGLRLVYLLFRAVRIY